MQKGQQREKRKTNEKRQERYGEIFRVKEKKTKGQKRIHNNMLGERNTCREMEERWRRRNKVTKAAWGET